MSFIHTLTVYSITIVITVYNVTILSKLYSSDNLCMLTSFTPQHSVLELFSTLRIFKKIPPNYSGRCRLPGQREHSAQTAMLFKERPNQYKFPPMPPGCVLQLKYSHNKLATTGWLLLNGHEPDKDDNTWKTVTFVRS